MGKVENLPKWAQIEFARLELEVKYWKQRYSEGPDDSDTFTGSIYQGDSHRPLGKGERVLFVPGGLHEDWPFHYQVRLNKHGELEVMVSGRMSDYLAVLPVASNIVRVVNREWA